MARGPANGSGEFEAPLTACLSNGTAIVGGWLAGTGM
jgi:hypothetical protein